MAFTFNNCLIPQGAGFNALYENCCQTIECVVTNTSGVSQTIVNWTENQTTGWRFDNVLVNGLPVSIPLTVPSGGSFNLSFNLCAGTSGESETIKFSFDLLSGGIEQFPFDFNAIDMSTSVFPETIDFGNVAIGGSKTIYLTVYNPTAVCYQYMLETDCPDIVVSPTLTDLLCSQESQNQIAVTFSPTTEDVLSCGTIIGTDCISYYNVVSGKGVIPSPASNTQNGQKNKVDQTTRVENCSPRTVNNQCSTARTMQSAIRSNARRFGKR